MARRAKEWDEKLSASVFKKVWDAWQNAPAEVPDEQILLGLMEAADSARAVLEQFQINYRDRLPELEVEAHQLRESRKVQGQ